MPETGTPQQPCCPTCGGTGQVSTTVENMATGVTQPMPLTETCLDCL
jgi:hypothetical protein